MQIVTDDQDEIMGTMKQLGQQLDNMQNKLEIGQQSSFESLTEVKDIDDAALDEKYIIQTQKSPEVNQIQIRNPTNKNNPELCIFEGDYNTDKSSVVE